MQGLKEKVLFRDNLKGDRLVEYSFVMANLGSHGRRTLDVGSCDSPLPAMLSGLGCDVYGIDTRNYLKFANFKNFEFVLGDMLFMPFHAASFDRITAVSTLEHVGLYGRYGSREHAFGDRKAMGELSRCLKTGGKMIITLPYGKPCVLRPYHRIYDKNLLSSLFNGFRLEKAQYFVKDDNGCWTAVSEKEAGSVDGSGRRYALGLFVLTKT